MTSGQTPSRPTNRTGILTELKDTSKTLDETIKSCTERKNKIEMLIKALSEEQGGLKSDGQMKKNKMKMGLMQVIMKMLLAVMRIEVLYSFCVLVILLFLLWVVPWIIFYMHFKSVIGFIWFVKLSFLCFVNIVVLVNMVFLSTLWLKRGSRYVVLFLVMCYVFLLIEGENVHAWRGSNP